MYDYIQGKVASLSPTQAVLDVSGVGYLLSISLQTYTQLEGREQARLFVQMVVREDAMLLYGFASEAERELFRLLISVSGIGAGTARVMLSAYRTEELAGFIASGNVASIKSIKGIGTKTAERVIIDLKDKVLSVAGGQGEDFQQAALLTDALAAQAADALMVLGYTKVATQKAVRAVCAKHPNLSLEEIIRAALQLL